MSKVISFRPSAEESNIIERTRRARGFRRNAEALRFLIQRGARRQDAADQALLAFRLPKRYRLRRSLTSDEIDDLVYRRP